MLCKNGRQVKCPSVCSKRERERDKYERNGYKFAIVFPTSWREKKEKWERNGYKFDNFFLF